MLEIIPAILTNNPNELREKLLQLEGVVDHVQIDVIDGKFVDNKTVDLSVFDAIETLLRLDFHLMVEEPIDWVEKCIRAGADRVIGHIEKMNDPLGFLAKVQSTSVGAGIAFDLDTQLELVESEILKSFDVILVMAVPAGFGGQKFNEKVLEKVNQLSRLKEDANAHFRICVDGGVTKDLESKLEDLGVDEVVEGKSFFERLNG